MADTSIINSHSSSSRTLGIITTMSAFVCSVVSMSVYYYFNSASIQLTTTEAFVDFAQLRPVYSQVTTVGQAVRMNATLLRTAWCMEPTGNFNLFPETRSPACSCINNVYASFLQSILPPVMTSNNTSTLSRVIQYVQRPWNNDTVAAALIATTYNASNVSVSTDITNSFATQTVNCLTQRATWKIYPYFYNIHPAVLSFYTSFTLFLLGYSYMLRVEAPSDTSSWAKMLLFPLAGMACIFLVLMNVSGNWFYVLAIICVTVNFYTALNDEFQSTRDVHHLHPHKGIFSPPHPLMVGMWYYIQLFFPILVVYMAMMNFVRDVVGLLCFYILGYVIAFTMQRMFWTKWYVRAYMTIESYIMGYPHLKYTMTEHSSSVFRGRLMFLLTMIGIITAGCGSLIMFINWYPQLFCSSNWAALIFAILYGTFFVLDFFASPPMQQSLDYQSYMPFGVVQMLQVALVIGTNISFVIITLADSTLK